MSMSQEEYLEHEGNWCPNCSKNGELQAGNIEVTGMIAFQQIVCLSCQATFTDELQLIGYSELQMP